MCGVFALLDARDANERVAALTDSLRHRGPDSQGAWHDPEAAVMLGHTRLSIIDLSASGAQPMVSDDGRFVLAFNGEIYNYRELRAELPDYPFRSTSDTEVLLAAWARWGLGCLDRLIGMFAFAIWDRTERVLTIVRDRFGVKPLFHGRRADGAFVIASEIRALHAAGIEAAPDETSWATYLTYGLSDHSERSFWRGVHRLPPGHFATWSPGGSLEVKPWYDLVTRCSELDTRNIDVVSEEYTALLKDSVRLRFRADVSVGINLSGGLDSSLLLALVPSATDGNITAYSYVTGDARYDERPWMDYTIDQTRHAFHLTRLSADEVPALAEEMAAFVSEPYGGVPTLAYAKLFRVARSRGTVVLLDGQGMDEQWGGYDYYQHASSHSTAGRVVQGSKDPATRPECLSKELSAAAAAFTPPEPFDDRLRNLQWQDFRFFKLARALRFSDRVSMASSTELREPFLDHRLVEIALRQPADRKIRDGVRKWLMREIAADLLPDSVRLAAKRPIQTPQREWLRGPLRNWATGQLELALEQRPDWFDASAMRQVWARFLDGEGDNSFWVWQWLSVAWIQR